MQNCKYSDLCIWDSALAHMGYIWTYVKVISGHSMYNFS